MKFLQSLSPRLALRAVGVGTLILVTYLAACARSTTESAGVPTVELTLRPAIRPTTTATPAVTIALEPTDSPIPDAAESDYYAWLASRPRNMEAYGFYYDPDAKPTLPPPSSVSMSIWQYAMPLQVIEGEPIFLARPTPEALYSAYTNLTLFGCMAGKDDDIYCKTGSDLLDLECEALLKARGVYVDTGVVQGLIGRCVYPPPMEDEPQEDYLFRSGCAFRKDVGYIFYLDGELRLIKTPADLRQLFSPITTPEEAVNYAQLMTGLVAEYQHQPQPEYLYFYDPIDATRVEITAQGYRVYLFHYLTCMCEPWTNSEVELLVSREGEITWVGARPWSMTVGFSCAD